MAWAVILDAAALMICLLILDPQMAIPRRQAFAYSRRKPSPQRLIWPTEGDGKCIVQHNVSVSQ
jgi:hypothetical protein